MLIVTAAPEGFAACSLSHPRLRSAHIEATEDGLHAFLSDDEGGHHLWYPQREQLAGASVLIPLDGHAPWRVKNALRLYRRLQDQPAGPWPREQKLSRFQLHRAALMLRAFDGVASGASWRQVASVLLNRDVERLRALDWKNAPERRRLGRILKNAHETIESGYLRLLAPRIRRR